MTEKYQNKYRIPSARLKNWDYGSNAPYFITICTQGWEYYFGDIADGKMQLSEIGRLAEKYWYEIPQHFPFVQLGAFVVMPNHIHGIIVIDKPVETPNLGVFECNEHNDIPNLGVSECNVHNDIPNLGVSECNVHNDIANLGVFVPNVENRANDVKETARLAVSTNNTAAASEKWKSGTLGVIVNQYKRFCTINARKIHADFAWQPRFYDHIIRNDQSFQQIEKYIHENPMKWDDDKFYHP